MDHISYIPRACRLGSPSAGFTTGTAGDDSCHARLNMITDTPTMTNAMYCPRNCAVRNPSAVMIEIGMISSRSNLGRSRSPQRRQ